MEFLERIKAVALFFDGLSKEEIKAIKHWIKNTVDEQLAESALKILDADREDVEFMVANNAFILKEMKEEAKNEGREEGRKEGRREGRREGDLNRKIKSAQNLLPILDDETIASSMELDIEIVKKLRKESNL